MRKKIILKLYCAVISLLILAAAVFAQDMIDSIGEARSGYFSGASSSAVSPPDNSNAAPAAPVENPVKPEDTAPAEPQASSETKEAETPSAEEKSEAKPDAGNDGGKPSTDKPEEGQKPDADAGKKDEKQEELDTDFSSIQVTGLTLCDNEKWYFEEFDEDGNVGYAVLYNKDSLVEKKDFTYKDKKLHQTVITHPKKIVEIVYNGKGLETENAEYQNNGGQKSDLIKKISKAYDDKNNVIETSTDDGLNKVTVKYTYNGSNKVLTETTLYNGEMVCRIEYKTKTKRVSLFDGGNLLRTFEEEL